MADPGQQEFDAMRERSMHTIDGLMADKMRYIRALRIACGGNERRMMEALREADAAGVPAVRDQTERSADADGAKG